MDGRRSAVERGAHTPGIERAPAALRAAGLLDLLGADVEDAGDVPGFRWRPDPAYPRVRTRARWPPSPRRWPTGSRRRCAGACAAGARRRLHGDCRPGRGLRAGWAVARAGVRGRRSGSHTPETRANGNLDAMGLAHMLGLPGTLPEVAGVGPDCRCCHRNAWWCTGTRCPAVTTNASWWRIWDLRTCRPTRCTPTRGRRRAGPGRWPRARPAGSWCTSTWTC
ncbi:hypothetical protein V2I01_38950 [Micromonospora sp. BRA006-A]|nr:hypothetical protein [Micromonospora sp. BRA006-A]